MSNSLEGKIKQSIQSALQSAAALPAGNEEHAVHEIRKSIKLARALLRLLGDIHARDANELAVLGRKLSNIRDAEALLETFDDLCKEYPDQFQGKNIATIRDGLLARKKELLAGKNVRGLVPSANRILLRVAGSIGAQPSGETSIGTVFRKRARRAEDAFVKASKDPDSETLHEWRRRVKEQWNQLRVLKTDVEIDKQLDRLHTVAGWLGDDHNLAVLRETIFEDSAAYGTPQDVEVFLDCAAGHERKLRKKALALGRKLYKHNAKRIFTKAAIGE